MSKLIYRVIAPCRALGYGFPRQSFETALDGRVDAIVCDAGSVHAEPFFLGAGASYFAPHEVRADLERIVAGAHRTGCPVILGSAGSGGGDRNVAATARILTEVFAQLGIENTTVATISSEVPSARLIANLSDGTLSPLGRGIGLNEEALRQSTIVGHMGVHPIMSALDGGAQYVIAGRACDASIFAADMIRRGINPGLAYHVGHVLQCGATACEPGSPADCLVAEIYDDGWALFIPPNPQRRCTVHSIASHSLYEESHPQLQVYPEGVLNTEATEFYARDARVAGIRGSRLVRGRARWSIDLEGVRRIGHRRLSLLYIDPADVDKIPADLLVYGRKGVQLTPEPYRMEEMGILIEATAVTSESAVLLASAFTHDLCQFAYPGRSSAAGNIAYPLIPGALCFKRSDGMFGALIPCGTADPVFFNLLRRVEAAIVEQIKTRTPLAFAHASHVITTFDAACPAVLVTTVDVDEQRLKERHAADIARISSVVQVKPTSRMNLDAPDAFEWSLLHVLRDEQIIREDLFPITFHEFSNGVWAAREVRRAVYADIAESDSFCGMDPLTVAAIDDVEPRGLTLGNRRLAQMAVVVRSQNAGIEHLTFDVLFSSGDYYEAALLSNAFCRANIAKVFQIDPERVVGTYFADACNAIKITVDRPAVAASFRDRDWYREQKQAALEELSVPIYTPSQPL
jgi:Domain of unknown function (DUF4387)/Acyclic terpene utilisation family protein AtuA